MKKKEETLEVSSLEELERRFYPWLHDLSRDCSTAFRVDVDGVQDSSELD